ncbi:MAG: hypothetical protein ACK6CT_04050 [Planctomycetia bacterium]
MWPFQHARVGSESKAERRVWLAGIALLAATAVAITALSPSAAPPPAEAGSDASAVEPDKVGVFMRAKLGHSQKVLEGLTVEDYDLIEKGAHDLALASQASSWQVLQTEDYARQSDDFRRSCNALRAAAKARNLDGAALAWMEVTMKCIQCHKYVRDTRREP